MVQASSFATELLKLGYRGAIRIAPYPGPKQSACPAFPTPEIIRVGFLGRLVRDKNPLFLLNSFKCFLAGTQATLEVYGDGPLKTEMKALALELGISKHVNFHGALQHNAVSAEVDKCHLFVFPSVTEGQCLAAVEVLSRGRPVVGSPVGALEELLIDRRVGRVCLTTSPSAFAETIMQVVQAIRSGEITPQAIREHFEKHLSRSVVVPKYIAAINDSMR
jgi:glycosyltransferase involved in cell wall biosynthesis